MPEQLRCELNRIIQYLNGEGECFINNDIFTKMIKFANEFIERFVADDNIRRHVEDIFIICGQMKEDNFSPSFNLYKTFIKAIPMAQMEELRNDVNQKLWTDLQYIRIIISDILFLKIIFRIQFNTFEINNVQINYIGTGRKVHPDSKLARELQNSAYQNNYIGVSHLCCIICSLFMDLCGFSFAGISKRLEPWTVPTDNINHIAFENLLRDLNQHIQNKHYDYHPYNRHISNCLNCSDIISNDICEFHRIIHHLGIELLNDINDELRGLLNDLETLYNTQRCCINKNIESL